MDNGVIYSLVIAFLGLIITCVSNLITMTWKIAQYHALNEARFIKIESRQDSYDQFQSALMKRMVDVLISPHTPEVDRALLAMRRGDKITEPEYRLVYDELEHQYEEALRANKMDRQVALSLFLAWLQTSKATIVL